MSNEIEKAADVGCPFSDGTTSNVKLFTMDTTHLSHALPAAWAGRYVDVTPFGGNVWVHFSRAAAREVDRTVAAAAAGSTNAAAGRKIPVGETRPFRLPACNPATATDVPYFNRESDVASAATVYVEVALSNGIGNQV